MHQFFPLLVLLVLPLAAKEALCISKFTRNDFPPDFVFGAGTSSYQGSKFMLVFIIWIFLKYLRMSMEDGSAPTLDDFKEYADLCFREFGDMVSHWTTIVEPNVHGLGGYDSGVFAPARCSPPFGIRNCTAGNSTVKPYFAVHNMLIAHAKVVRLYRTKYQVFLNAFMMNK